MPKRPLLKLKSVFSSAKSSTILAGCVGWVQLLCLAKAPQNPDGAEMVAAAMQGGGVLHPPGYPLQSWLDLVFIHLPFGLPATRLAMLSWICSVITVYLLSEILRRMGCSFFARVFGALCFYAFYPTVWSVSVQPEKYSLTALLMAVVLTQAAEFCLDKEKKATRKDALLLGAAVGLGAAQHTIMILTLPIIGIAGWRICWSGRDRWAKTSLALATAVALMGGLYLSLFWLSRGAIWPDWGKLTTLRELVRHVLRSDFVFMGLSRMTSDTYFTGFEVFFSNYWPSYSILGVAPVIGAVLILLEKRGKIFNRGLVVFALIALIFLFVAKIHPPKLPAYCFLERYCMPFILACSILSGFAFQKAWEKCRTKIRPILAVVSIALCFSLLYSGWGFADASKDRILDFYREALGATLDPQAIYITGCDLETLYGTIHKGVPRYAIIGDYPWALQRVDPEVEPRLNSFIKNPPGMNEISKAAYDTGHLVMSTFQKVLESGSKLLEQRGFFWATGKSVTHILSEKTVEATHKICEVIEGMDQPAPKEGHYYSRFMFERFRYAFYGATNYLEEKGKKEQAELTRKIGFGLFRGESPEEWISACRMFNREPAP